MDIILGIHSGVYTSAEQVSCWQPCPSTTEDDIVHVEALIQDDKWCKLLEMVVEFDLLKLVIHEIVLKKLGYQKMLFHWVQSMSLDTMYFKQGIYLLMQQQDKCIKLCSAHNIWTITYLYKNKCFGWVNIFTFFF